MDKKKILVVEDEMDMAKLMGTALRAAGFEVANAFDGSSAVREALNQKPDLIVLDLMMPAGGGFFALEKIKLSTETLNTPVIIYSAIKDEERVKEAMDKGADAYFEKTSDISELIKKINELLTSK